MTTYGGAAPHARQSTDPQLLGFLQRPSNSHLPGPSAMTYPLVDLGYATIVRTLTDVQVAQYSTVSSVAMLVYDIILTFDVEHEFIWGSRFTSGTFLYAWIRYGNVIQMLGASTPFYVWGQAPDSYCKPALFVTFWTTFFCNIPMMMVLTLRTYATCNRDRRAKWLLAAVCVICIVALLMQNIWETVRVDVIPTSLPGMPCIYARDNGPRIAVIWEHSIQFTSMALFYFVMFFVTFVRLWQLYALGKTRLIQVILRDSFWYFCVLFSVTIGQLIMLFRLPTSHATLTPLLGNFARALTVIVTSRMMLNLRHAARAQVSIDTLTTLRASGHAQEAGVQSIVFGRPSGTGQYGLDELSGTTPQV